MQPRAPPAAAISISDVPLSFWLRDIIAHIFGRA